MWGWSVDQSTGLSLLDCFYDNGGRWVDTAKNYPLNGDPAQFMFAENVIEQWLKSNKVDDLKIIAKVGSLSNELTVNNDLSAGYLQSEYQRLAEKFGVNLQLLMIHWDNRDQLDEITESVNELLTLNRAMIGLSGIKNPSLYALALEQAQFSGELFLQMKYNFLHRAALTHYQALQCFAPKKLAYGIGMSGLKLNKDDYQSSSYVKLVRDENYHDQWLTPQRIKQIESLLQKYQIDRNLYQLALLFCQAETHLDGYIIGPSKLCQLENIFSTIGSSLMHNVQLSDFD